MKLIDFFKKHRYFRTYCIVFFLMCIFTVPPITQGGNPFGRIVALAASAAVVCPSFWFVQFLIARKEGKREPTKSEIKKAQRKLDSAKRSADILNTTSDPNIFFPEYKKILKTLKTLSRMEKIVDFSGTMPSQTLQQLDGGAKWNASVNDFLDRYIAAEKNSKKYSVLCKELERYRDQIPEECFARMERLKEEEEKDTVRGNEHTPIAAGAYQSSDLCKVEPPQQPGKRVVSREILDEEMARAARLERMRENARITREREEAKRKAAEERRSFVASLSEEELFDLALEFVDRNIHVSAEALSEDLPGIDPEKISEFLDRMEAGGLIQKTNRPGAYLCIGFSDEFKRGLKDVPASDPKEGFDFMDGHEFEEFCAEILRGNGFDPVEVTQASGDFGIDILAEKDGITYAIQCKCYSDKVGNHAVQEAYSGARYYKRMVPAVMTNQYFTEAAKETARETGVLLWDKNKLEDMIQKANK